MNGLLNTARSDRRNILNSAPLILCVQEQLYIVQNKLIQIQTVPRGTV